MTDYNLRDLLVGKPNKQDLADRIEGNAFRDDESYLEEIRMLRDRGNFWIVIAVLSVIINLFQIG